MFVHENGILLANGFLQNIVIITRGHNNYSTRLARVSKQHQNILEWPFQEFGKIARTSKESKSYLPCYWYQTLRMFGRTYISVQRRVISANAAQTTPARALLAWLKQNGAFGFYLMLRTIYIFIIPHIESEIFVRREAIKMRSSRLFLCQKTAVYLSGSLTEGQYKVLRYFYVWVVKHWTSRIWGGRMWPFNDQFVFASVQMWTSQLVVSFEFHSVEVVIWFSWVTLDFEHVISNFPVLPGTETESCF